MQQIHLQAMVGPTKGRATTFEGTVIAFGRADDCQYTVPLEFISRHHGEIRFEGGKWKLHNLSPGGTRVNRRRVTSKPKTLANGDVVSVGDRVIFRVQLGPPGDEAAVTPKPTKAWLSSRARLWTILAIYIGIVLAIMMLFNLKSDGNETSVKSEDEWTRVQIEDHLTRDLPPNTQKNAQYLLEEARQKYESRDVARRNLYDAYIAYRWALALSGSDHFENADDVLHFADVKADLIDRVTRLYKRGHAQLLSKRWTDASDTFDELLETYPHPDRTSFYKHVVKQRTIALTAQRKKRRRGQ